MALSHAILTFLLDGACSGYDLTKRFEGSVGFFWKASHQQIYRELAKLEAQGWAQVTVVPQEGKPDKKLYDMTQAGRKALIEWIEQPSNIAPLRDDLLVKLFAGQLVPRSHLFEELDRHRQMHQSKLNAYRQLETQYFAHPDELPESAKFQYATLLQGIQFEAGWLTWCDRVKTLLAERG
ncbi:MAG: PadR family transcriptional regulator [Cyanobacteria bacterium J06639_1]